MWTLSLILSLLTYHREVKGYIVLRDTTEAEGALVEAFDNLEPLTYGDTCNFDAHQKYLEYLALYRNQNDHEKEIGLLNDLVIGNESHCDHTKYLVCSEIFRRCICGDVWTAVGGPALELVQDGEGCAVALGTTCFLEGYLGQATCAWGATCVMDADNDVPCTSETPYPEDEDDLGQRVYSCSCQFPANVGQGQELMVFSEPPTETGPEGEYGLEGGREDPSETNREEEKVFDDPTEPDEEDEPEPDTEPDEEDEPQADTEPDEEDEPEADTEPDEEDELEADTELPGEIDPEGKSVGPILEPLLDSNMKVDAFYGPTGADRYGYRDIEDGYSILFRPPREADYGTGFSLQDALTSLRLPEFALIRLNLGDSCSTRAETLKNELVQALSQLDPYGQNSAWTYIQISRAYAALVANNEPICKPDLLYCDSASETCQPSRSFPFC